MLVCLFPSLLLLLVDEMACMSGCLLFVLGCRLGVVDQVIMMMMSLVWFGWFAMGR